MTTYDPEDKAERRRVGGLLHEPCTPRDEEMEVQNSSTTAEHNSTRKIFAVSKPVLADSTDNVRSCVLHELDFNRTIAAAKFSCYRRQRFRRY